MDEKSFFWPVFFILAGTAALMVNFGVLPPESWRFWPLVVIIPALIKLSGFGASRKKK
jgi:hypothetical protein